MDKLRTKELANVGLRELQQVGRREFAALDYRVELSRRMAKKYNAHQAVLFDDVACAVPPDQRPLLHGLPGYERALLPGLLLAPGFPNGASVLVAAPPNPVEMSQIHSYKASMEVKLEKPIEYHVWYESEGNLVDLMNVPPTQYGALTLSYAGAMNNPQNMSKYNHEYHVNLLQKHEDVITPVDRKSLVIPFQSTPEHGERLSHLVETNRVALPDIAELDKAHNNLLLREHGFKHLPQIIVVSQEGKTITQHKDLPQGPQEILDSTSENLTNFSQGVVNAVDALTANQLGAYIKLDSSGVSGLSNISPFSHPEVYDQSIPAEKRSQLLSALMLKMGINHIPHSAVVEEFVDAAEIEGITQDYTVSGQMVDGVFLPLSIAPFGTNDGVYDRLWVAAQAEQVGEDPKVWTDMYDVFGEMGDILAQHGYRDGLLVGDVFVRKDGSYAVHDYNFRRGGRSTPEALIALEDKGLFEAQTEVQMQDLGKHLANEDLVMLYTDVCQQLAARGVYVFSTSFGYFGKKEGDEFLKFKTLTPVTQLVDDEGSPVSRKDQLAHLEKTILALVDQAIENNTRQIGDAKIYVPHGVWPPYKSGELLTENIMPQYVDDIQNGTVMDVGTGSGLLAVKAGLLGATRVIATDLNPAAMRSTALNWKLNNLDGAELQTYLSDGLNDIPDEERGTVDVIIANPPVQPYLRTNGHPTRHGDVFAWNEAEANGRGVLDQIILTGIDYIKPNGKIITSTSTRHGHAQTVQQLETMREQGQITSWKVIHSETQQLADFYMQYLPIWQDLQAQDNDTRVWPDDQGNWYHDFIVLEITK